MKRFGIAVVVVLSLALGAGVNAEEVSSDEGRLRERATGFWKAKVDFAPTMFEYYVPESKGGPNWRDTSEMGSVQFTDFEITHITIEGDEALVTTRNTIKMIGATIRQLPERHSKMSVTQPWMRVDGEWYKRPVERGFGAHRTFRKDQEAAEREMEEKAAEKSAAPEGKQSAEADAETSD